MLSTVGGARRGGGGAVPRCAAGGGCRRAEGAIRSAVRRWPRADRGRSQVGGPARWCSATPHGLGGRRRARRVVRSQRAVPGGVAVGAGAAAAPLGGLVVTAASSEAGCGVPRGGGDIAGGDVDREEEPRRRRCVAAGAGAGAAAAPLVPEAMLVRGIRIFFFSVSGSSTDGGRALRGSPGLRERPGNFQHGRRGGEQKETTGALQGNSNNRPYIYA
ncbi:unnamed protein product [Miscanthus lutarioriparius]|uniref:Uncharacterized protein n=1 Tax=Miscanthus lutarioriparius TaxID=422564 RepID=A0A811P2S4_9POAL|nr:unnamed protein product [Miscanthus lutarioriparius]